MNLVNAELVLWVAGLTAAAIEVAKSKMQLDLSRLGPVAALGLAEALTAVVTIIGVAPLVPEGANWFAWVGLHGVVAALVAMGGYDLAKRAFTVPDSRGG